MSSPSSQTLNGAICWNSLVCLAAGQREGKLHATQDAGISTPAVAAPQVDLKEHASPQQLPEMAPEVTASANDHSSVSRPCAVGLTQQDSAQHAPDVALGLASPANAEEPPESPSATASAPHASIVFAHQPVVSGAFAPRAFKPTLPPVPEAPPGTEGSQAAAPEQQHAQSAEPAPRADTDVGISMSLLKTATGPAPAIKPNTAAASLSCLINIHAHAEICHVQEDIPGQPQETADTADKPPGVTAPQQDEDADTCEEAAVNLQSIQGGRKSGKRPSGLPSKDLPVGWQAHSTESDSSRSHSASHEASLTQKPAVERRDMQVSALSGMGSFGTTGCMAQASHPSACLDQRPHLMTQSASAETLGRTWCSHVLLPW